MYTCKGRFPLQQTICTRLAFLKNEVETYAHVCMHALEGKIMEIHYLQKADIIKKKNLAMLMNFTRLIFLVIISKFCQVWVCVCVCPVLGALFIDYASSTPAPFPFLKEIRSGLRVA